MEDTVERVERALSGLDVNILGKSADRCPDIASVLEASHLPEIPPSAAITGRALIMGEELDGLPSSHGIRYRSTAFSLVVNRAGESEARNLMVGDWVEICNIDVTIGREFPFTNADVIGTYVDSAGQTWTHRSQPQSDDVQGG